MAEWTERFFADPLWIELQRGAWTPEQTEADVEEIARYLEASGPMEILDAPCGDGRIAIGLARRGHRVVGVDMNPAMIDEGRARIDDLPVELRVGDMRAMDLPSARFDGAVCWQGSFGYFDEPGDAAFVREVADALMPGGRFVIEMANVAEALLPRVQPRGWDRVGSVIAIQDRRVDLRSGRLDVKWTLIHDDGRRSEIESSMRLYPFRELAALLESMGFEDVRAIDRASGRPYQVRSSGARLAIVARRR